MKEKSWGRGGKPDGSVVSCAASIATSLDKAAGSTRSTTIRTKPKESPLATDEREHVCRFLFQDTPRNRLFCRHGISATMRSGEGQMNPSSPLGTTGYLYQPYPRVHDPGNNVKAAGARPRLPADDEWVE